jgi:hypothetical protein
MIAGIVLACHATIATRNVSHFGDLSVPVIDVGKLKDPGAEDKRLVIHVRLRRGAPDLSSPPPMSQFRCCVGGLSQLRGELGLPHKTAWLPACYRSRLAVRASRLLAGTVAV